MLFREEGDTAIAVSQPSHAWLSGQLARAWGNRAFDRPTPHEEVCLGAEQHDIGWLLWETSPTFNRETGRPHEFREVDTKSHTLLWTRGVHLAMAFGLYPALLVSLHANTIYGSYFDFGKAAPEDARLVRDFLARQKAFQSAAADALGLEGRYTGSASRQVLERNRLLIAAVDRLSLEICWGVREAARVPNVLSAGGDRSTLEISPLRDEPGTLLVSPWPFADDRVEILCEGRRIPAHSPDEATMRRALEDPAARVTIRSVLQPR